METRNSEQSGCSKRIITCGTIAGALTAIFVLLGTIGGAGWKYARPFIFGTPTAVPTATYIMLEGQLIDIKLEYGVSLSQYLQMTRQTTEGYSQKQLNYVGALANFKARISGFSGQTCRVRWSLYNSTTQKWLYGSTFDLFGSTIAVEKMLVPERDVDQASTVIWIATPGEVGYYFARLELYDPKDVRLDYIDSVVFQVK